VAVLGNTPSARARQHEVTAREHDRLAADERRLRDGLIRQLRADNPKVWTYAALAKAVGITETAVRTAIKG